MNLRQLFLSCRNEAQQWRARMPRKDKKVIDDWCRLFEQSMSSNLS
jgi:hypothetical protein